MLFAGQNWSPGQGFDHPVSPCGNGWTLLLSLHVLPVGFVQVIWFSPTTLETCRTVLTVCFELDQRYERECEWFMWVLNGLTKRAVWVGWLLGLAPTTAFNLNTAAVIPGRSSDCQQAEQRTDVVLPQNVPDIPLSVIMFLLVLLLPLTETETPQHWALLL